MRNISDEELLYELSLRLRSQKKALESQASLTKELNAISEKLLFSELLKTNFLSNIRNEINNPITAVLELSKSIVDPNLPAESLRKFAALIHNEVAVLDFQLRNILVSAEIEAGETRPVTNTVKIISLIDNVIQSFKSQYDKKDISVSFNCKIEDGYVLYTDAEKLHLIISNLISNAIQFNKFGGAIEIFCSVEHDRFLLRVKDTGIGISAENISKIYDRFRQLELGSAKTYGGHGLGLSVTKALLELINGEIKIESVLDEGSSFTVSLDCTLQRKVDEQIFSEEGNDFLFSDMGGISF